MMTLVSLCRQRLRIALKFSPSSFITYQLIRR